MRKLFGTDGIRGLANSDVLNIDMCLQLARAIVKKFCDSREKHTILIGKDTRISCDIFEHALAAALCSYGVDVQLLGIIPTPAVSILTKDLCATLGIVISASHNVFSDNGIKLFNRFGVKLTDREEEELENIIFNSNLICETKQSGNIGRIFYHEQATELYSKTIKRLFDFHNKPNIKIVVDCANGAFSKIAPRILREYGFDVVTVFDNPNGININDNCGVTHPHVLSKLVLEHKAVVGIAFDGDGDRIIMVDENGCIVDGEHMLAYLAIKSDNCAIVSTIMANLGLENFLMAKNIKLIRTNVGDRYISECMQQHNLKLGGEPSGHIIIKSHASTCDGLYVALTVLDYLLSSDKKCSYLNEMFASVPFAAKNITVANKSIVDEVTFKAEIQKYESSLLAGYRLIIRASGTEPIVRIFTEGEDENELQKIIREISAIIKTFQ